MELGPVLGESAGSPVSAGAQELLLPSAGVMCTIPVGEVPLCQNSLKC